MYSSRSFAGKLARVASSMNDNRSVRIQSRKDEEASLFIGRNCGDCAPMTNVHDPSMRLEAHRLRDLSSKYSVLFVQYNRHILWPCA